MTIPAMLAATAAAVLLAPLAIPILAISDLVLARIKLPKVRVYLFALQYLINDSIEIFLAPLLWLWAGFGSRLDSPASVRRHTAVLRWSANVLLRRGESLLGLRVEVEGQDSVSDAPAIVMSRHVNTLDCSLVGVVSANESNHQLSGVIMADLLSDPGFDLMYGRLACIFVDRDGGASERDAVKNLGESMGENSIAAIFPEGQLFRPHRLARELGHLEDKDPARAARLTGLKHLLPPKPGGALALLEGAPEADVVILGHIGFEDLPSLRSLAKHAPVPHPIRVRLVRFERSTIPTDRVGRVEWLDQRWLDLDNWIEGQLNPTATSHTDVPTTADMGYASRSRTPDPSVPA